MEDLTYLLNEGGDFVKLTKLPNSFVNLLEAVFCGFDKNPKIPNFLSKLLESPLRPCLDTYQIVEARL
jgi:hypothetical protein